MNESLIKSEYQITNQFKMFRQLEINFKYASYHFADDTFFWALNCRKNSQNIRMKKKFNRKSFI